MERHEEMLSPEEQYAQLAPTMDADGFSLYAAAEEISGLKVHEEFPYEDNRGMFEMADGHTLLRYLEAAYFGTVTWEIVPGTPYERATPIIPLPRTMPLCGMPSVSICPHSGSARRSWNGAAPSWSISVLRCAAM